MPRVSRWSKLIYFDVRNFTHDLDKAMKGAVRQIANEVVIHAKRNVSVIPFKKNPVKLYNGGTVTVTSDADRKAAVINSIFKDKIVSTGAGIVRTTVHALGLADFKDASVGLYYEYGTGEKALEVKSKLKLLPAGFLGTPNKYRTGKQIVSRSKHIDYCGMGKGIWRDLGGNIRITGSRMAGRRTPGFIRYIGEDVEAYLWFKRAIDLVDDELKKEIIKRNLATLNPAKYMHLEKNIVL